MLKRGDSNASILLHAITDECLSIDFILIRWYQISLTKSGHWAIPNSGKNGNNKFIIRQYNACSLCDEIVILWRLIALDPRLSDFERENVYLTLFKILSINISADISFPTLPQDCSLQNMEYYWKPRNR